MLQLGGYFAPRRTFYPVALKLLRIVTKVFVTFPEYMWATKCRKSFSDISTSISNMAAGNGHPTKKARKSYVKGVIWFLRHIKT